MIIHAFDLELFQVDEVNGSDKCVSTIKFSGNRRFLAVGYVDGSVRLYDRKNDGLEFITFTVTVVHFVAV